MSEMVQIILFGSLRNTNNQSPNPAEKLLPLAKATSLKSIIHKLDVQDKKVQLVMRYHHAVPKEAIINPGDRLAMFPVEYPVYPDWEGFRLNRIA